jgi:hypothetical protein
MNTGSGEQPITSPNIYWEINLNARLILKNSTEKSKEKDNCQGEIH